jgi:hypothetical protein
MRILHKGRSRRLNLTDLRARAATRAPDSADLALVGGGGLPNTSRNFHTNVTRKTTKVVKLLWGLMVPNRVLAC